MSTFKLKITSILMWLPLLLWSIFVNYKNIVSGRIEHIIGSIVAILVVNLVFYYILNEGLKEKYRLILFCIMVVNFVIEISCYSLEYHGRLFRFSQGDMINKRIQFCPIAIPNLSLLLGIERKFPFPSTLETFYPMFFLVLGVLFFAGRGWCGWNCFFCFEEIFRLPLKKPLIKINSKWTYLPYAILISTALISLAIAYPFYCDFLCPVKAFSEYEYVSSNYNLLKAIIMYILFFIFIILIPLISKKRGNCSFLCPLGALGSLFNNFSPVDIVIDESKCKSCGLCFKECPVYAIEKVSKYKIKINCIKCGKCIEICPTKSIGFHIKLTPIGFKTDFVKYIFLYPLWFIYILVGGGIFGSVLTRLVYLITTGSMLYKG